MPKSQNKNNKLTFIGAAYKVLEEEKGALHYKEITKQAEENWGLISDGVTSWQTMYATINEDIKKKGKKSKFIKIGKANFSLQEYASSKKEINFIVCAEKVLKKSDEKPMHYKDIAEKAKEEGLVSIGKTSHLTMYSTIVNDIKKRQLRGEEPLFEKTDKATFGLATWSVGTKRSKVIRDENDNIRKVREELKKYLIKINPYDFEKFIAEEVFRLMGFKDIEVTKKSGDAGIDVIGTLLMDGGIEIKFAAQVKRWKKNIGSGHVRNLRGSAGNEGKYEQRQKILITTSKFTKPAKKDARLKNARPINLIDGDDLIDIMLRHEIGVTGDNSKSYKIIKDFPYFDNKKKSRLQLSRAKRARKPKAEL